jgi:hypothetical protein
MTPFEEGRAAYYEGATEADNPFDKGTDAHARWLQGFSSDTCLELDESAMEED